MTNTQKRISSAAVLASVVAICLFLGAQAVLTLILIVGMVCVDEVYCNFMLKDRKNIHYFINQVFLIIPFIYFNLLSFSPALIDVFVNAGLVLNFLLIFYVFRTPMDSAVLNTVKEKYSYTVGLFFLLPLMSLGSIIHYTKWHSLIGVLLFVNFGMDIGAWMFGKKFGKRKLWPSVSPNKTIEGLLGGILVSASLGTIIWLSFFGKISLIYVILFGSLGGLSQLGDLVESKMKRQCDIKDSSSLIPGHGGFYDRIDSLVFVAPFYATALRYIYF